MRERSIPSQPGLPFKLNRNFPKLDSLHIDIAGVTSKDLTLRPSPASENGKIKCLVNSFDASGGNTSWWLRKHPSGPTKSRIRYLATLLLCPPELLLRYKGIAEGC